MTKRIAARRYAARSADQARLTFSLNAATLIVCRKVVHELRGPGLDPHARLGTVALRRDKTFVQETTAPRA